MNAINFIQQHGVKRAKECLPAYEKHYCGLEQLFVEDLKRLVESVELVDSCYKQLIGAKREAELADELEGYSGRNERLKQAIADYEAIGGEHV